MKIRVFYSKDCARCKVYIPILKMSKLKPVFVDSEADANKELCDKYDVDELPHTQIIGDDGTILINMLGVRTPQYIIQEMQRLKKEGKK